MANLHVIIPVYNHWELCHNLLWKMYRNDNKSISSVLVVDDCSTDANVEDGARWWSDKAGMLKVTYLQTPSNLGFLKTSNLGLSQFKENDPEDVLVLISTDVEYQGSIMPTTMELASLNSLVGGRLLYGDTGWNKFGDKVFPYLEGWFLAASQSNWSKLGLFDERYAPYDFEDVDLSTKAISLGMDLCPLNHPSLKHLGGQSIGFSATREAQTLANRRKFAEKWKV